MSETTTTPPPPGGRRAKPRRRMRLGCLLLPLLLIAGVVAGGAVAGNALLDRISGPGEAPDYPGTGTGRVIVEVKRGDTAADIGATLLDAGVVKSQRAFTRAASSEPRSVSIQVGFYALRKQMSASSALELLFDPKSRVQARVTIPEGYTVKQILATIADKTDIPADQLEAAAADLPGLGVPDYAGGNLEGFLFPATYEVAPGATAQQVLRQMVARYNQAAESVDLEGAAAAVNLTPYEALIVASIIERESRVPEEYPKVARVIYNRIKVGEPLYIDATILYGLGRTSGGLTESDLEKDTPYNTRLRAGLPPGPIASPGEAAMRAALQPADGPWRYYVLMDEEGNHFFTDDYDEFLRQKKKSQDAGIF